MSTNHDPELTDEEAIKELKAMKLYEKDMLALLQKTPANEILDREAHIASKRRHVVALKMAIAALVEHRL